MKKAIYSSFLALLVLILATACKKETITPKQSGSSTSSINGKWNLVRIYGGIAGVNETHNSGEIEWIFSSSNHTLTVNNNTGSSTYYYLPSGTYNFQQISNSNQHYLVIDANELGLVTISGNQMHIDENKKSDGEGACGFYVELER